MSRLRWALLQQLGAVRAPTTPLGIASAVLGVALATALIAWLRSQADIPNLSMLYLLVVLSLGSVFGLVPAVLAAVLSFLAFNYFFVEPIHTFHVANPHEWLALVVLLLTAIVTGHLASTLRRRASEAEAREREVASLYELSQLLAGEGPFGQRLALAARKLAEQLEAAGCEVLLPTDGGRLAVEATFGEGAASWAGAEQATQWALTHGAPAAPGRHLVGRRWVRVTDPRLPGADGRSDLLCWPLLIGERCVGVVRLNGITRGRGADGREMQRLRAAAALLAQVVERERLAAETTEMEVLRGADQVKTALLSSVSHDLRTPLASIKASVTSLLNERVEWDASARRELLDAVDQETDRLTRFVSRLLELSRVEGGAVQPRKDWHAVEDILSEVAERLDPSQERVQLQVPANLPPANLDYVMVEQILTNLVENALKYSPAGQVVEVSAESHNGHLSIAVVDRGPGIPPAEREHVFERFYRSPGLVGAPGTGMGLPIARGLAQAHGGDVEYAPHPDGGSVFTLKLPISADGAEQASPSTSSGQAL